MRKVSMGELSIAIYCDKIELSVKVDKVLVGL